MDIPEIKFHKERLLKMIDKLQVNTKTDLTKKIQKVVEIYQTNEPKKDSKKIY